MKKIQKKEIESKFYSTKLYQDEEGPDNHCTGIKCKNKYVEIYFSKSRNDCRMIIGDFIHFVNYIENSQDENDDISTKLFWYDLAWNTSKI